MVDYSRGKDIEISDDEDNTHPNIDTPSLFRWRHQARVERMEEHKREKAKLDEQKRTTEKELKEVKDQLQENERKFYEMKIRLEKLEKEQAKIRKEEDEWKKKEKLQPWNVDTISKGGFQKTVINKSAINKKQELTEDQKELNLKEFIKQHKKQLKQYGMMKKYEDSKKFLRDNYKLVCEDTANYLVIWCIELEMQDKHELMAHVAHQCICMQYILDIAKQLDVDPRVCLESFFQRIQVAEAEYKNQFLAEIESFKERIRKRAQEKVQKALEEQEEEERKARLGPGGLDPVEVFESLPKELQACFETRDIAMLQEAMTKLPEKEACYHLKRCIDSGMWVPGGNKGVLDLRPEDEVDEGEASKLVEVETEEKKEKRKTRLGPREVYTYTVIILDNIIEE